MPGSSDVREPTVVQLVAGRLHPAPDLVDAITNAITAQFPELAQDDDIRRAFRTSVQGNLAAVHANLVSGEPTAPDLPIAPEQIWLARSLGERGMPLDRILAAYRLGRGLFWRTWASALSEECRSKEELTASLQASSDEIDQYLDRAIDAVVQEYQATQQGAADRDQIRRRDLVRALLAGDPSPADIDSQLSYRMRGFHTALVLWLDDPSSGTEIAPWIGTLARETRARAVLSISAGATSHWLWLLTENSIDPTVVACHAKTGNIRAAMGTTMPGHTGFVASHHEAQAALRAATTISPDLRFLAYQSARLLTLVSRDRKELIEFVRWALGDLADTSRQAAQARETLEVYLREGRNASRTSTVMNAHKNTVSYRVRKAERLRGRPINEHAAELAVALQLRALMPDAGF